MTNKYYRYPIDKKKIMMMVALLGYYFDRKAFKPKYWEASTPCFHAENKTNKEVIFSPGCFVPTYLLKPLDTIRLMSTLSVMLLY